VRTIFFLNLFVLFFSVGVASSYAQTQRANIPTFTPTVGWDISPTQMADVRGLEALKLPCIMKAGFNNGFVIRFSGGGNRIMAMAIDFRQQIFSRGQTYNARININRAGARTINAEAFSSSVLLFDLKNYPNLYRQLVEANNLGIEVEGNSMEFALGDIKGAFQKLEQCYSQTTGQPTRLVASQQANNFKSSRPSAPSLANPVKSRTVTQAPIVKSDDLSRPRMSRPISEAYQAPDYSQPRVAGAELAKSMREPRFAKSINKSMNEPINAMKPVARATVPAPVSAPQRVRKLEMPTTMPDVTTRAPLPLPTGLSDRRVSRAIDDDGSVRAPRVNNTAPVALVPETISETSIASMTPVRTPVKSPASAGNVWNANAGDDMRNVLERWADRAGVDLQWDASNNGKVARDVNVVGSFEQAVQTLMAQNAAALGLEADMRKESSVRQASVSAPASSSATQWQGSMGASKWMAASGASLRETLQSWSVKEGVAFLWKAGREYKVKAPVQNNEDYTSALQELLNQYANDTLSDGGRPAAQFNVDPASGNKLLTVE